MTENFDVDCDFDFSLPVQASAPQQTQQQQKQTKAQQAKEQTQLLKEIKNTASKLSPEDVKKKTELILRITQYEKSSFGEQLKAFGFTFGKALRNLSIDELEEQLLEMQTTLTSDPNSSMVSMCVNGFVGVAENLTQFPAIKQKCNLLGWGASLNANPEFGRTVELLSLQHGGFGNMSPEMKLLFIMSMSGYSVACENIRLDMARQALAQEEAKLKQQQQQQAQPQNTDQFDPSQEITDEMVIDEQKEEVEPPILFEINKSVETEVETKIEDTKTKDEPKPDEIKDDGKKFKLRLKK